MAQPIQQLTIQAPAFFGLNTSDSPVGIDPNFASIATNCVIDKQGRIGARKGLINLDGSSTTKTVESTSESFIEDGSTEIFSAGTTSGVNKIYKGTTLTELALPSGYTITDNNWKIVSFRTNTYFFQKGHNPLVYEGTELVDLTVGNTGSGGSLTGDTQAPQGNEALSAFGRIWVAGVTGFPTTIFFSDDLIAKGENAWTPQSGPTPPANNAGSLNISENLPDGPDEIVALHGHNGFLIVFCKRSILIYKDAESPTTINLADTISGVGCVSRDSVQNIGTDVLFLSETGVRSLGRVIQEKSLPMRDVSKNIRNDLLTLVDREVDKNNIKSGYSSEEAFYLLTFPTSNTVVCFDIRSSLPDNSFRVTTWSDINPLCFTTRTDRSLVIGKLGGLYKYSGFFDKIVEDGAYSSKSYQLSYFSNPMNFGNSTNLKFLKKLKITVIGNNSSETVLNWGYDYTGAFNKQVVPNLNPEANFGEFGISEYNTNAEYSGGEALQNPVVNGSGSGSVLTIGLESKIEGTGYSVQQIDVSVLLGRTI